MGKILGSNVDPLNPYFVDVLEARALRPGQGQEAPRRGRLSERLRRRPQGGAAVLLHGAHGRGHRRASSPRSASRAKIEQIEWGQWLSQVLARGRRLRHVDHRPRRGVGHRATSPTRSTTSATTTPTFQELFQKSEVTVDDKKRRELYVKMQKMLADEAPAVWLYMHPRLVVAKKGVHRHLEGSAAARPRPVRGRPGRSSRRAPAPARAAVRRRGGSRRSPSTLLFVSRPRLRGGPRAARRSRRSSSWAPRAAPRRSRGCAASMGLDRPLAVQYVEWIGPGRSAATSAGRSSTTCRWRGLILSPAARDAAADPAGRRASWSRRRSRSASSRPPGTGAGATTSR